MKWETECSKCGSIKYNKYCVECLRMLRRNRRLDTKRRLASNPSCINCGDDAKFEYFIVPPHKAKDSPPARWCPLCDRCWDNWLEQGDYPPLLTGPFLHDCSSIDRPLMQDERDALKYGRRAFSHDASTGLLTMDWRRSGRPKRAYKKDEEP